MSRRTREDHLLSRRALLKGLGCAPVLALRPSPLHGSLLHGLWLAPAPAGGLQKELGHFPFAEMRLRPHYPSASPLEDVLRLVPPGTDAYVTEKYAFEVMALLQGWATALKHGDAAYIGRLLADGFKGTPFKSAHETKLRSAYGIEMTRRTFERAVAAGREEFLRALAALAEDGRRIETAEFEITSIKETSTASPAVLLDIRYDLVSALNGERREERIGAWRTEWVGDGSAAGWKARHWEATEETVCVVSGGGFVDVTQQALGDAASYKSQLLRGSDEWRSVLDGACGIDVYGNNGVAAGDYDNDGWDDLYICQPAGLPNRLYRNRGDGTFEDVTDKAGVGVLDGTACALFADFQNRGLQDLLVVCVTGPLLFVNRGDGTFALKQDAFQFAQPPQGSFTHAAVADYDGDGRLDLYFCLYSYYLGLDQYHYPVPYFDARNGPPNFLLHNEGDGTFVDRTEAAGLKAENDRYSFACAWGALGTSGLPDLYVANDFGRNNLYRNKGDGTFEAISEAAHAQDVGAGMSAAWADINNDGKQDIYVANMWSAAGQRVSGQAQFHEQSSQNVRADYRQHARGNALYRNQGDGKFENATERAGVAVGRWAWCSDFWDFDHDGYADLYVANGYISAADNPEGVDLGSFFWRQVVAKSPDDSTPNLAYEHGWQALNELIRSDHSWSGHERNVMYANHGDGSFSEISGALGLDFLEDSRSFALADLDHDGRLEVVLKNRNAPQLRILHNAMRDIGHSIAFRLRGQKSNRDAIGSSITVEAGELRQTKYLQAGSGFLAQHSKEVHFGVGRHDGTVRATVRWPSGLSQTFDALPVGQRIEIVEAASGFTAKPFGESGFSTSKPPAATPAATDDARGKSQGTWLIDPLKAPAFTLPDLAEKPVKLSDFHDSYELLTFWTTTATASRDQLKLLHAQRAKLVAKQVKVVAINVDDPSEAKAARTFAAAEAASLTVLFATEDVAGIYNIIFRYLFDRRRDLPIPSSFLLDREGMIVKVYQGMLQAEEVLQDVATAPATAEERMRRALPFAGKLCQSTFQRNEFTYGVAMFQHGYLQQAEASFQRVVADDPNNAEGYYNLGTLNLRKNNFDAARHYLEQTLKLRPNYPEAWNNLGMMAAQQGHADEAVQDFQQSLALRPAYAIALLNLGNVYRRQGEFAKAREALSQALALQPDDPEANYSLGMFYAQQNDLPRAADYLKKAAALRPAYPEALNNLGILFVREQDYPQAEAKFRECIRVAPAFDQSYINLARLFMLQHDKDKAMQALQDLLKLQPENANARQAMEMLQGAQ